MNKILKEIIKEITPDKSIYKEVDETLKKINNEIKKRKIKAKAVAGGSIAKGTFLKYAYDVDIFVKFDLKYKKKNISEMLRKILKDFKATLVYGSRNYYQIKNKFNYEVVPVLDIKKPENAVNVTDMSPFHAIWAKRVLKKKTKFVDEIRLAKHFCKANNIYGAESYIRGFSGHVLDILVIYYNGFINLLKNSKKWKEKQVVDFYNYHKGKALFNLNKSKISSLIVIDPIDPNRNAAAALSKEKLEEFRTLAKNFLKKPSKKFFEKKEITKAILQKMAKEKKLLVFDVESKKGKEDIIGAKLFKALNYIERNLVKNDFNVIDYGWDWDKKTKAIFYFILEKDKLPKKKTWEGPPLREKEHVKKFKRKYKNTYTKKNKIYTRIDRKYSEAKKLIRGLSKSEYVRKKLKKIKNSL